MLGQIGDARAAYCLVAMMEEQAGTANAIRARDALISLGAVAAAALIEGSTSANREVRYHIAQILGILGSPMTLGIIEAMAQNDKSKLVRESATEAYKLVTLIDANVPCTTVPSSFWFVHLDVPQGQDMDVVNGNVQLKAWQIDAQALRAAGIESPDFALMAVLITAYQAVLSAHQTVYGSINNDDCVILIGFTDPETLSIGFLALSEETDIDSLMDTASEGLDAMVDSIVDTSVETVWLATTNLIPRLRFTNRTVIVYQTENSLFPQKDTPLRDFGPKLDFIFRNGYVDRSWVYRQNLQTLKDQGIIKHIPVAVENLI